MIFRSCLAKTKTWRIEMTRKELTCFDEKGYFIDINDKYRHDFNKKEFINFLQSFNNSNSFREAILWINEIVLDDVNELKHV